MMELLSFGATLILIMGVQNPKKLYGSVKANWNSGKRFTAISQAALWVPSILIIVGTSWGGLAFLGVVPSPQELYLQHTTSNLTPPITNISFGQGGSAAPGTANCSGGGAGGGGRIAEGTIAVTSGEKLQIHIGKGGITGVNNGNGGDTYISDASGTPLIFAQGGKGGQAGTCK